MKKCQLKLADRHGDLADLLLKIVNVLVGLFLKPTCDITLQIVCLIGPKFGWYCGLSRIENLRGPARFATVSCTYAAW